MQLWTTNKAIHYVNSFIVKGGSSRSKFYLVSSILQSLQVFEFHFVDLDILCLVFVQFFDHFQCLCVPDPSITQQHKHQIKIWMFLTNNTLCPSNQPTQHIIIIMILVSGKLRFSKNFNFWVKKRKKCSNVCVLTLNVQGISRIRKLGSNWRFENKCKCAVFLVQEEIKQRKKSTQTNKQTV